MKKIAIFGSTGSIGTQTLDVISQRSGEWQVVAIAAHRSFEKVCEQIIEFNIPYAAMTDRGAADKLRACAPSFSTIMSGDVLVDLIDASEPDVVINALVGAAGLRVTEATLKRGIKLGLANKESLVVGGELVMPLAGQDQLLPVDSEHSAIFQCLQGEKHAEVSKLWVTASGGPFRMRDRSFLETVTPAMALAHPTWNMGPKISIDSSTLVNKALEVIEAHHLFNMPYDKIRVVVHPQSCVHSMVEFIDGSVKAHLGTTDMRIPIQYALSYPNRFAAPVEPLDFTHLSALEFSAPRTDVFRCLALGIEAGKKGGSMPVIFNAVNEVAVAAFLSERIPYLGIEALIERALNLLPYQKIESFNHIEAIDAESRIFTEDSIRTLY